MGMEAEVIVIGPFDILTGLNVQDYPIRYYEGVQLDDLILGTVARAYTTDQSRELAKICGVKPWDLGNHQVKTVVKPMSDNYIGCRTEMEIYELLFNLLKYDDVQIWYRPNG